MDSKFEKIDQLREFILKLTDTDINEVDEISLSSAQKSRIAVWCENNEVSTPDLDDPSFWKKSVSTHTKNFSIPKLNLPDNKNYFIGIDIQSIKEFTEKIGVIDKNNKDLALIFTEREISYAESKTNPKETLTGIFSAKEAILKCMNTKVTSWRDIEIKHKENQPHFKGTALNISHSKDFAIAVALFQKVMDDNEVEKPKENILIKSIKILGLIGGFIYLVERFWFMFF